MGLFKKKPTVDPADFLALRAELQDVKARLEASERAKYQLEARVGTLDATTSALSTATSSSSAQVGDQLTALRARVDAAEQVAAQLPHLQHRVVEVEGRTMPDPAAALAPQMAELASRIDEVAKLAAEPVAAPVDTGRSELEVGVRAANDTVARLSQQLDGLSAKVAGQSALSNELEVLNERIGELQAHAGAADEVRLRVERLTDQSQVTAALSDQMTELAGRVEVSATDAREARAQAAALDARIANVGTELANQLSELGTEIDALVARQDELDGPVTSEISEEVLTALRAGQVRLAGEQARYEIAFRNDLATLAEQVRTLRPR